MPTFFNDNHERAPLYLTYSVGRSALRLSRSFRLPWFRRRKNESDVAAARTAAPPVEVRPDPVVTTAPAAATKARARQPIPTRPKRRRGSRGGKGRKKPGTGARCDRRRGRNRGREDRTAGEEAGARERARPERKAVSQRQERRRSESSSGNRRRREPQRRAPLPEAKRELIVSVDVGEQRVAVLEDDKVAEVYLERPERRSIAGNIYLGQVDNVLPGHGGRVRRDRPREERLPLRRRDRRPGARARPRPQDPGPDQQGPDDPRAGGQGPDEDEGRAADDADLAARPLRRLRPAGRRARRLAPARRRRAPAAEGHPQEART